MPYRRGERPYYYVEIKPRGYPRKIGPLSTGLTTKREARKVESTLRDLAATGRHEALDRIVEGDLSVTDVHAAEAAGRLEELLRDADDPPLGEAAERFMELSCSGRDEYGIRRMLKVAPDGARLSWIADPENLGDVLLHYLRAGYAPRTIHREFSPIRKFVRRSFDRATQRDLFEQLDLPTPDRERIRYLERDEIERVRKASGDWWHVFGLFLATGMRRGELVKLQRRDVNLRPTGGIVVTVEAGKTDLAARDLPVTGEIARLVRNWIRTEEPASSDRLFPMVDYRNVYTVWKKIRMRAKVEDATIHSLRHSYAVAMAKAGMPMIELQNRLGHEKLETTMRYAKYAPDGATKHLTAGLGRMGLGGEETPTAGPTAQGGAAVNQGSDAA
jgi:integrase